MDSNDVKFSSHPDNTVTALEHPEGYELGVIRECPVPGDSRVLAKAYAEDGNARLLLMHRDGDHFVQVVEIAGSELRVGEYFAWAPRGHAFVFAAQPPMPEYPSRPQPPENLLDEPPPEDSGERQKWEEQKEQREQWEKDVAEHKQALQEYRAESRIWRDTHSLFVVYTDSWEPRKIAEFKGRLRALDVSANEHVHAAIQVLSRTESDYYRVYEMSLTGENKTYHEIPFPDDPYRLMDGSYTALHAGSSTLWETVELGRTAEPSDRHAEIWEELGIDLNRQANEPDYKSWHILSINYLDGEAVWKHWVENALLIDRDPARGFVLYRVYGPLHPDWSHLQLGGDIYMLNSITGESRRIRPGTEFQLRAVSIAKEGSIVRFRDYYGTLFEYAVPAFD